MTILEASVVAGGSSGKAGGFIAVWATPRCLAPLSFKLHNELAKQHHGDEVWGHRRVHAAEVKLQAQNLDDWSKTGGEAKKPLYPKELDWLAPRAVQSYDAIGTPKDSGQVSPFLFTSTLAKLAQERGAKLIIGSATSINYTESGKAVESVSYETKDGKAGTLEATDVVVAAGPWTPNLLPAVKLLAPRGHSIVVKPTREISPYILFTDISAAPDTSPGDLISPDIYPRPVDSIFGFDTVYSSGPDNYSVPLPNGTDRVEVDDTQVQQVWDSIKAVSREIHNGSILVKQACYKPQIRKHEEGEEVGPMVGSMGIQGLWLATGHDEWGIQNAPGTGLVMSEMILEGEAKSADCTCLDPRRFLNI